MEGIALCKVCLVLHLGIRLLAVVDKAGRTLHKIFQPGGTAYMAQDILKGICFLDSRHKAAGIRYLLHPGSCILVLHIPECAVE